MNYNFDMHGKWVPTRYFNETVDYFNEILGVKKSEKENEKMKITIFYESYVSLKECGNVIKYYVLKDDMPGSLEKYEYIKCKMLTTTHEVEGYVDYTLNSWDIKECIHSIILDDMKRNMYVYESSVKWMFRELTYADATRVLCFQPLEPNTGRYLWEKNAINAIYGLNADEKLATNYSAFSWKCNLPEIKNVIYNMPATIVEWSDGTKTVSKCEDGEIYDREKGLMAAYMQKMESIKGRKLWKTLNKWMPKGLDMNDEPVNENMSTYVQSKLSRDHEKACKKLDKQIKAKTGRSLKKLIFETEWDKAVDKNVDNVIELAKGDLSEEEAEYIKNDIMATADYIKRLYQTKQEKDFAEVWNSLPKDVKEAAESKIAEAVEQANIDDDRTKEPALEKKDQLNQEFDKLMNPPVDNDIPEWNKWSLRKDRPLNKTTVDRHKYLPVLESHDGFDSYEKSSYLTPSEASKWLRKNDHDIVVAIDEYKGIYYTGEDMSWQLMSRIIETIDNHDIHNVIFNRHKEMLYPPIESWESLNGKPRKIGTPDKLINFEYLCLMVVR